MPLLFDELNQQPAALFSLIAYYQSNPELLRFQGVDQPNRWVLTGMGASYHAAWIGALYLNELGIPAVAVEAVDLVNYARVHRRGPGWLVYISQSGSSAEVDPILADLDPQIRLIAVTNHPESELAHRAERMLPLMGDDEQLIASKTYVNSLVLLWLLARQVAGLPEDGSFEAVAGIPARVTSILARSKEAAGTLMAALKNQSPLVFLGHGPHAATARQSAMILSEWPKVPALYAGTGAFRHGFIEAVRENFGVVVFAAPGPTYELAYTLSRELAGYGATVLRVENGQICQAGEAPQAGPGIEEFLSPVLDIIPIQLLANGLAEAHCIPPGFRYISKVVKSL